MFRLSLRLLHSETDAGVESGQTPDYDRGKGCLFLP
jgi:hypothetical protein